MFPKHIIYFQSSFQQQSLADIRSQCPTMMRIISIAIWKKIQTFEKNKTNIHFYWQFSKWIHNITPSTYQLFPMWVCCVIIQAKQWKNRSQITLCKWLSQPLKISFFIFVADMNRGSVWKNHWNYYQSVNKLSTKWNPLDLFIFLLVLEANFVS